MADSKTLRVLAALVVLVGLAVYGFFLLADMRPREPSEPATTVAEADIAPPTSRIDRQAPGVTNSTATLVISNPEWSCSWSDLLNKWNCTGNVGDGGLHASWSCSWSNNLANWRCGSTLAGSSVAITPTYLAIDGHEP